MPVFIPDVISPRHLSKDHSAERITTVHAQFCLSLNPHFTPLEVNITPLCSQRASATRPDPRRRCAPRAWATACARRGTGASGATPARTDGGSRLYHNILIICYTLPDHAQCYAILTSMYNLHVQYIVFSIGEDP